MIKRMGNPISIINSGALDKDLQIDEIMDDEEAVSILMANGILFVSGQDYAAPWDSNERTAAVLVECNDVFYFGTSDAEPLPRKEILNLYSMWEKDRNNGVIKWCCLRRGIRPQARLVELMKADGSWDNELEALPLP